MTKFLPSPSMDETKPALSSVGKNRVFYRVYDKSTKPVSAVAARPLAHGAAEIGQGGKPAYYPPVELHSFWGLENRIIVSMPKRLAFSVRAISKRSFLFSASLCPVPGHVFFGLCYDS